MEARRVAVIEDDAAIASAVAARLRAEDSSSPSSSRRPSRPKLAPPSMPSLFATAALALAAFTGVLDAAFFAS